MATDFYRVAELCHLFRKVGHCLCTWAFNFSLLDLRLFFIARILNGMLGLFVIILGIHGGSLLDACCGVNLRCSSFAI